MSALKTEGNGAGFCGFMKAIAGGKLSDIYKEIKPQEAKKEELLS
ncbi:hypothetical protein [Mucilaginibacter sp. OK268]|jgi:hypothetical protein|nr:hypothetical protein [Mucilaginibacter sp. OK268]